MYNDEIYSTIKELLIDKFNIQSELISPEKLLDDELDLDSLDAVDLLLYLEEYTTGKPNPGLFKNAQTVQDLIDILHPLWRNENREASKNFSF